MALMISIDVFFFSWDGVNYGVVLQRRLPMGAHHSALPSAKVGKKAGGRRWGPGLEPWPWTWPWGLAEYPSVASGSIMLSVGSRQGQLRGR
jgi:hypothetical protein